MNISNILNETFYNFDYEILKSIHIFLENGGLVIKPLIRFFDLFGTKGIGFLIVAIILFFYKKEKKESYMMAVSLVLCLILNSFIIKKLVARPRPFVSDIEDYKIWWQYAGSIMKDSFSFMSGHTLCSVSCILCFFFDNKNIKFLILTIIWTFFTVLSRVYLVVHYPSDCLFGIVFGILFSYLSYIIVKKYKNAFDFLGKKIFPFLYK